MANCVHPCTYMYMYIIHTASFSPFSSCFFFDYFPFFLASVLYAYLYVHFVIALCPFTYFCNRIDGGVYYEQLYSK